MPAATLLAAVDRAAIMPVRVSGRDLPVPFYIRPIKRRYAPAIFTARMRGARRAA
jgi:hypothetical protein